MKQFAIHFRDHVIPRLHDLLRSEAVRVLYGIETFSEASSVVMDHARKFGATHLPNILELEDWIATTLLKEIDEAEVGLGR